MAEVKVTKSILNTIKKMLGVAEEYHAFDIDILTDINAVFLTLNQLGVGPATPFQIASEEEEWGEFSNIPGIQTYVYQKVRLMFDPPPNSFLVNSIEKQTQEMEWRMMTQASWKPETAGPSEPGVPDNPDEPGTVGDYTFREIDKDTVDKIWGSARAARTVTRR